MPNICLHAICVHVCRLGEEQLLSRRKNGRLRFLCQLSIKALTPTYIVAPCPKSLNMNLMASFSQRRFGHRKPIKPVRPSQLGSSQTRMLIIPRCLEASVTAAIEQKQETPQGFRLLTHIFFFPFFSSLSIRAGSWERSLIHNLPHLS